MKIFNETLKNSWNKVVVFLKGLDNLYLKFILTIIAIALSAIANYNEQKIEKVLLNFLQLYLVLS